MNILLNKLPNKVLINDEQFDIYTDFRIGIQFEMMMSDTSISQISKMMKAVEMYFPKIPSDMKAALDQLIWFYSCGIKPLETKNKNPKVNIEPMFSYEQDQFMI